MKTKHTPGPWMPTYKATVGPGNQATEWAVWPCDESKGFPRVCSVVDGSRAEANARLIAAAPELMEALRDIVRPYDKDDLAAAPAVARAAALLARIETP